MYSQPHVPIPHPPQPRFATHSWDHLSREEQLHQIRELIASPYWSVLPGDIQERFLDDLYRN